MTRAARQRAEVVASVSSACRWLAEVRATALRRAVELAELHSQVERPARLRAFLDVLQHDQLVLAEAAESALDDFEGGSIAELVLEIPD